MDNGELFDKYIKATLEDGAEDVPAELWDNIQARIPVSPSSMGRTGGILAALAGLNIWWKRAIAGVALACIATAAIILFMPEPASTVQQEIAVAEAIPVAPAAPATSAADIEETATDIKETPISGTLQSAAPLLVYSKPTVVEEKTVVNGEEPLDVRAETTESAVAPEIQPFILDEPEETVRKRRLEMSAYANGADNIGESRYNYGRLSINQMTFGQNETLTETEALNYMIPISAGIAVRYNFTDRWALSIGLNYTYLNRHFKGVYDYGGIENFPCDNINNDQHFIGIPVNAFYTIHSGERVKFYASAGGAIEKCVYNKYSFNYTPRNRKVLNEGIAGVQVSAGIGLGMQVNLTNNLGLYIDPNLRYYFKNYLQPKSIRTIQPLQLGFELGLRWDL